MAKILYLKDTIIFVLALAFVIELVSVSFLFVSLLQYFFF